MKLEQNPNLQQLTQFLSDGSRRIHLIGVAGSGMSGLAGLMLALGHKVSGCDRATTQETHRLQGVGLDFYSPHTPEPLQDAELVIYSSAIKPGNLSYDEAVRLELPMIRRAEALAGLMTLKQGVVVCGMHGKTTTSSMAAYVLRAGALDPSHYIGAEVPILGTNAHWNDDGEHLVSEGDESDGTLALYHPQHTILLNIEEEHMDFYRDLDHIREVFKSVLDQTGGKVIYNGDDPESRRLCQDRENAISFGFQEGADYLAHDVTQGQRHSYFKVRGPDGSEIGRMTLRLPGRHNIANALSVIALATELGIDFPAIHEALDCFRGARRRFESLYEGSQFRIVDDYGHHPTEIKATLQAAKNCDPDRVVVMFQPHRYSRTQLLFDEFVTAFDDATAVFLADIYAASEDPIEGITAKKLAEAMDEREDGPRAEYVGAVEDLPRAVAPYLRPGDMLLSLGAGNVHEAARVLVPKCSQAEALLNVMDGDGRVRIMEPLSDHTTLRVGGPADYWVEPETIKAFARAVKYCRQAMIPMMVMGRGSNLLVRDGGVRGVVFHLHRGEFREVEVDEENHMITAGAGVKCKAVAAKAQRAGIGGFEWMEGIPGAVGGALRMNAGAMGSETFSQVKKIVLVDDMGEIIEKTPEQLEIRYRSVPSLQKLYAVKGFFQGEPRDQDEIDRIMNESQEKRRTSQPVAASAGCIFKNPDGGHAGKLVDELGLKNHGVGPARVSDVHANFIVNDGGAKAAQVLELIEQIRAKAREERGIELETEVEIVGEDSIRAPLEAEPGQVPANPNI